MEYFSCKGFARLPFSILLRLSPITVTFSFFLILRSSINVSLLCSPEEKKQDSIMSSTAAKNEGKTGERRICARSSCKIRDLNIAQVALQHFRLLQSQHPRRVEFKSLNLFQESGEHSGEKSVNSSKINKLVAPDVNYISWQEFDKFLIPS